MTTAVVRTYIASLSVTGQVKVTLNTQPSDVRMDLLGMSTRTDPSGLTCFKKEGLNPGQKDYNRSVISGTTGMTIFSSILDKDFRR